MIPKKIHWCWFGRGEKPPIVQKCVESWRKYCPDYEIIEWNEDNFDITCNEFVKGAYEQKKYAFVADYVRLAVLYRYGGIYLDSDVEIVQPLDDDFLNHKGFSGFESILSAVTGIMGSEKGFTLFEELLTHYKDLLFTLPDGSLNMTTNTEIITNELLKKGLVLNNNFQIVNGLALYPSEYFCPLDNSTGILHKTSKTYAIHWFSGSWIDERDKRKTKRARILFRLFGKKNVQNLSRIKHKIWGK